MVSAYRGLWSEGLVQGRAGGGTVVALPGRKREAPHPVYQPLLWDDLYTERVPDLFPWTSAPRLPADEEPLNFARGDPATDLLPLDSMWEGLSEVKRQGHASLRYAPPQGNPELRARLAESLELRGMRASPSQILVLSGGGQGTYLAAQAFLERGDGVVVESPTYPEALRIFRAVGAQLRPVPLDEGGLRLDVLEETLSRLRPKLIYVTPTFHNPIGITMPTERRERLLELACRYRVPILEDDPFPGLCYDGESVPPLAALDRQGTVLHLSTLSKVFAAGLRIGWLLSPVAERLTLLKSSIDLCTSPLSQAVATALFPRRLSRHLETIVPIYRSRRDTLCAALVREGANALRFSRPGGRPLPLGDARA